MKNLEHLCFDKDGILIDVHAYWRHTTEIRATYLKNKLQLNSNIENSLIDAMGIDIESGKIKNTGPVGHKPRGAIIQGLYQCLTSNGYTTNPDDLNQLFLK